MNIHRNINFSTFQNSSIHKGIKTSNPSIFDMETCFQSKNP